MYETSIFIGVLWEKEPIKLRFLTQQKLVLRFTYPIEHKQKTSQFLKIPLRHFRSRFFACVTQHVLRQPKQWFDSSPKMFYLIGLGLGDAKDITVKGLEIVKAAKRVYLEAYTSILTVGKDALVSAHVLTFQH